jgi:hypothetical protein
VSANTPGPWSWDDGGHDRGSRYEMPRLIGKDGEEVCNFGDAERYYPTEGSPPNEYDARLIAAAPELLAALQAVAYSTFYVPCIGAVRDQIDAAIAKATGSDE